MAYTSQRARSRVRPAPQRGFGGLFLLFFVGALAGSAALFAFYRIDTVAVENVRHTTDVVATAKAALIGYAVQRGRTVCTNPPVPPAVPSAACLAELAERPGDLPCPDTNNDGVAEPTCIEGAIGRFPWRTVGIPEPRDNDGEVLWYAISGNFRNRASWPAPPAPPALPSSTINNTNHTLNSDTRGTITVRAADNATVLATDAAAVIFAAGGVHSAQQNRSAAQDACTVLHATQLFERRLCPTNYLETATFDAATRSVTRVFVPNAVTAAVNDRVAYITTAEIITPVELRVAGEVKKLLEGYRANSGCQCYPWAEDWPYLGGIADIGQNRGRFPTTAFPHAWGDGNIPVLPPWLDDNDWHNLIWYAVGKANAPTGGRICRTCSALDMLSVVTQEAPLVAINVSALFFMPGMPAGGTPRLPRPPSGSLSGAQRSITDDLTRYLEDARNNDNHIMASCPVVNETGGSIADPYTILSTQTSCDIYTRPQSPNRDRDRLYTFTSPPPSVCAQGAQVLADHGPCRVSGNTVNAICTAAYADMVAGACSQGCLDAAKLMVNPPCRNNHNSPGCPAAIATLNSCSS